MASKCEVCHGTGVKLPLVPKPPCHLLYTDYLCLYIFGVIPDEKRADFEKMACDPIWEKLYSLGIRGVQLTI